MFFISHLRFEIGLRSQFFLEKKKIFFLGRVNVFTLCLGLEIGLNNVDNILRLSDG